MAQQLTRQALFDMIWQTPMKRLAIELGITPQALSKLCDSFEIPKPGYGYWTLREMGRPVEIPALGVNRLSDEIITIEAPMRRVSRSRVSATPKSSIPELTPKLELKDVDGAQEPDGSPLIVSPALIWQQTSDSEIVHNINLMLELFGEVEVRHANLASFLPPQTRRVNWTLRRDHH